MKILVLASHFPPDLSAGAFRMGALMESLEAAVPPDATIEVVTTVPNRYGSYVAPAPEREHSGGVDIVRIPVPAHRAGMAGQVAIFLAYARGARRAVRGRDYDLVFATSAKLMTAFLGAWIARRKRARLYLDIRDIFLDGLRDLLPRALGMFMVPVLALFERWAVARADRVNLVSGGFLEDFQKRYPTLSPSLHTNGVDDAFVRAAPVAATAPLDGRKAVTAMYAGNLGEGQGLHNILPNLATRLEGRVRFKVIGDGGRRAQLEQALARAGVTSVEILPPVAREALIREYQAADVLFLHLNDFDAFRKVLPSKIFEYAALGKPVWAGVAGFPARFIESEVDNAAVFPPCDAEAGVAAFERLALRTQPRHDFIERYGRARISAAMADEIVAVASGNP